MEVHLPSLQLPSSLLLSLLICALSFIGHRMMKGMDRIALSVERLNQNMAVMFSKAEGFDKRIGHLEHRLERK